MKTRYVVGLVGAVVLLLMGVAAVIYYFLSFEIVRQASDAQVAMAQQSRDRRDYRAALLACDQAVKIDPQNPAAYAQRAQIHFFLGEGDAELADAQRAVKVGPRDEQALRELGWAHEAKLDWKGALSDYNKALSIDPSFALALERRGYVRLQLNDSADAKSDLEHALQLNERLAPAYEILSRIEMKNDDFSAVIDNESKAIELAPEQPLYWLHRAEAELRVSEEEGALADTQQAISLSPRWSEAYYYRGIAQRRIGNPKAAIESLNKAVSISPKYYEAYFQRGIAQYVVGDLDSAQSDLVLASPYGHDRLLIELWIWIVTAEQGDPAAADDKLGAYLETPEGKRQPPWELHLAEVLLGRTMPENAVGAIDSHLPRAAQNRETCQVWFYAAQRAFALGDRAAAKSDFRRAIDSSGVGNVEFTESQRQIDGL